MIGTKSSQDRSFPGTPCRSQNTLPSAGVVSFDRTGVGSVVTVALPVELAVSVGVSVARIEIAVTVSVVAIAPGGISVTMAVEEPHGDHRAKAYCAEPEKNLIDEHASINLHALPMWLVAWGLLGMRKVR